jgi:hypothetical protein
MICGVVAGEFRSYGELLEGRVELPRVGAVVAGGLGGSVEAGQAGDLAGEAA